MKSVRIGAVTYSVTEAPIADLGLIDYAKQTIVIQSGLAPAARDVTLWHEIIHGVLYNLGYVDHNENLVDGLAHGIVSVLMDNPRLGERGSK